MDPSKREINMFQGVFIGVQCSQKRTKSIEILISHCSWFGAFNFFYSFSLGVEFILHLFFDQINSHSSFWIVCVFAFFGDFIWAVFLQNAIKCIANQVAKFRDHCSWISYWVCVFLMFSQFKWNWTRKSWCMIHTHTQWRTHKIISSCFFLFLHRQFIRNQSNLRKVFNNIENWLRHIRKKKRSM